MEKAEYIERTDAVQRIREMASMIGFENPAVAIDCAVKCLERVPAADVMPVPCKIGDLVYGIRNYKGIANVQKGFVSDMFFTNDMKLMVVVKHVCRGHWLEKVFPTREAAEAAMRKDGDG